MKLIFFNGFRLRTALLVCFIGLTLFSGLTITLLSLRLSYTARVRYTHEVGGLLTHSVSSRVENFLKDAEQVIEATDRFSFKLKNDKVDYAILLNKLAHTLMVNPNLGTAIYTEEKTGYTLQLSLKEKSGFNADSIIPFRFVGKSEYLEKDILVEEILPNPSGSFTLKTYDFPDFPKKPFSVDENGGLDFRKSPWYLLGKAQTIEEKGRWTNCYSFITNTKKARVGFTFLTALGDEKGDLFAVMGVDIGTEWVSEYLFKAMEEMQKRGVSAFVFEQNPEKVRMVLAHSQKEEAFPQGQNGPTYYSLPKDMKDPAIGKMLHMIPEDELNGLDITDDFENMFHYDVDGSDYVGMIKIILPGSPPDWYLCLYVPEKVLFSNAYWYFYMAIGILVSVMVISVILSLVLSRSASKPIEGLVLLSNKIGNLDFTHKVDTNSKIIEIRNLAHSMNLMQIGLHSFTQYLPKDMLKSLFDAGVVAKPGGKEKEVSIMFADIANFTHYSEGLSPNDLVFQLNEFLGCFSSVIIKNHGTVDKYIGDAVMAYWNAPRDCEDYAFQACKTAIQGVHNFSFLQKEWARLGKPVFKARIGINTGNVVLGNIGTEEHLNYTVIGDHVNLASRMEGLNKVYETSILISDSTVKACGNRLVTRPVDLVAVKGKEKKVLVHELLGIAGETSSKTVEFCEEFQAAFAVYLSKDWAKALQLFEKLAELHPNEECTNRYLNRCREYLINPPDSSWDGGQEMQQK